MLGGSRISSVCILFCVIVLHWLSPPRSHASILVAYPSFETTSSIEASELAEGMLADPLRRGLGLLPASGGTFNSRSWSSPSIDQANEREERLTWCIRGKKAFRLETLRIRYDRSPSGPQKLAIQLAIDGGVFENLFIDDALRDDSSEDHLIELDRSRLLTVAAFRLVAWDPAHLAGTLDVENHTFEPLRSILISGSLLSKPVPAPNAFQTWTLTFVSLILLRRVAGRFNLFWHAPQL